jgi:hypothetical protein
VTAAALIVLAQDGFVDGQVGKLICARPIEGVRGGLRSWRAKRCAC